MVSGHSKATIVSMAVIASAAATLLHEGLGHGVVAAVRGDVVTALTSNHLSAERPDKWVDAGGTIVNLVVGVLALVVSRRLGGRANARYFFWILAAMNLLPGAGYFLFSGVFAVGDWNEVIRGLPHQVAWRVGLALLGVLLTVVVVRALAVAVRPFVVTNSEYNTIGRLPYYAGCVFSCVAGALDPLGWKMMLLSTMPAAFGGTSGLMWADSLMPREAPAEGLRLGRAGHGGSRGRCWGWRMWWCLGGGLRLGGDSGGGCRAGSGFFDLAAPSAKMTAFQQSSGGGYSMQLRSTLGVRITLGGRVLLRAA